jgi:rRNA-processing protein FCF1
MIKVLLDTNFLIYSFDNKTALNETFERNTAAEFSLYTLDSCIEELERLGRKDVIKWLELNRIKVITTDKKGKVDDKIILLAKSEDYGILSEDRVLIKRAKSEGIKIIRFGGRGISII